MVYTIVVGRRIHRSALAQKIGTVSMYVDRGAPGEEISLLHPGTDKRIRTAVRSGRCGHLFCLEEWLVGEVAECPQCKCPLRTSEIMVDIPVSSLLHMVSKDVTKFTYTRAVSG